MAKKQKIYKICPGCNGTGIQGTGRTGEEATCTQCGGKKKIEWGYLSASQEEE
jgi:DnaJ-class molecular chaperone